MKKLSLSIIILFVAEIQFAQIIDTIQFAKWINENSIELNGQGLRELADVLRDKTIIGLGECIHGSKTINNVRFDVAKTLIENNAFNIVAFEMSFNIGLRINHFLQTGEGDIEQILKQGHFFTNSTEMLDFIKWIKKYNQNSDNPVILYGFDVQSNIDLVEDMLKYYKKTNKEAENLTATLIQIFEKNTIGSFRSFPAALKDSVMQIVSRLTEIHLSNRKDFVYAAGFNEYEYSAERIWILSNELQRINSSYGQSIRLRDANNAELVKWIKTFEGEKSKIILFAHNGHLGKSHQLEPRERTLSTQGFYEIWEEDFYTGYYLSEIFDDDYYFIGTQFGSGHFMGFDPENDYHLSKLEVTPPEQYSLTHLLQQANKPLYFIDLHSSKAETRMVIDYLRSVQSFYSIGAAYDYKYLKARLIDFFDAIIFIDKIEESNLLEFEK
ncbi:MAG: erythromycin esterase family protein [Marinilabiliaceae bacterium]|nr:erythromycin esterase family protein [Marinilabiliaceae bacterium]